MYEYPGIKSVYDLSQKEDSIILYFHTKGMFSNVKYPERNILRGQLFKYTIVKDTNHKCCNFLKLQ